MDSADVATRFDYHPPPDEATVDKHQRVRAMCRDVADRCNLLLPDGREKALVITHLEEAMFWANAAIARSHATTE